MKKILVLTMLVILLTPQLWGKICSCGSYSKGIYQYSVGDGNGCCSGTASSGSYSTYIEDKNGAWELRSSEEISGSKAQNNCCPNS